LAQLLQFFAVVMDLTIHSSRRLSLTDFAHSLFVTRLCERSEGLAGGSVACTGPRLCGFRQISHMHRAGRGMSDRHTHQIFVAVSSRGILLGQRTKVPARLTAQISRLIARVGGWFERLSCWRQVIWSFSITNWFVMHCRMSSIAHSCNTLHPTQANHATRDGFPRPGGMGGSTRESDIPAPREVLAELIEQVVARRIRYGSYRIEITWTALGRAIRALPGHVRRT
jgi:hypothetical protein